MVFHSFLRCHQIFKNNPFKDPWLKKRFSNHRAKKTGNQNNSADSCGKTGLVLCQWSTYKTNAAWLQVYQWPSMFICCMNCLVPLGLTDFCTKLLIAFFWTWKKVLRFLASPKMCGFCHVSTVVYKWATYWKYQYKFSPFC